MESSKLPISENKLIYDHLVSNAILDYGKHENVKFVRDESKIEELTQK